MQILNFKSIALCGLLAVFSFAAPAQKLLVANQQDSTLSVIDPDAARQTAAIFENSPQIPGHEVAVSADGRTAFVPLYGSTGIGIAGLDGHEMQVIDLPTRKIVSTIDFGHGVRPHRPVLDPASGLLYVTTELDQTITIIDPKTLKILGTVPTGQPQSHMLVLSRDGHRGYTANVGPGTVSVLDMTGRKTLAVIPVAAKVQRIAISVDDKLVFTADQTQPRLAAIDTATNQVITWIPLPGAGYGAAPTPDGRWLLIAIPSTNQVAVIDLKTMHVARTIETPGYPQEVLVRPDGKIAYVSCARAGKVAAVDLSTWNVTSMIAAGKWADGLAWAK